MNALLRVCTAAIALLWSGVAGAESVARVGVSARDLGALDPAFGIGNGDEFAIRQIYNTLVSPPDGTTKVSAERAAGRACRKLGDDPRRSHWTFHLRHGVQWHKGFGEVTSDDVAFTIERAWRDPKTGIAVLGANFRQIESVDTPDPYTVVMHLSQPNPFFYAFC